VFQASLNAGTNDLRLTNTGGINMYVDQIIYEPVGTPASKYHIAIRDAVNGKVTADVDSAAEGQTVTLTITPDEGYGIKELQVINSVYYTMGKKISVQKGATQVTFKMWDSNVTIQPVFADNSSAYVLDFTNVVNGAMPEGWRTTDGSDVHEYPNTYGSGSRTMTGFGGYQGKGLYWRTTSAEYGRQTSYPLNLEPGTYKLQFAMAAWKGTPEYKGRILNASGSVLAATDFLQAKPNANGSSSANLSSATLVELPFEVTTSGKHIISFINNGTGFSEFLLLHCRVIPTGTQGINNLTATPTRPVGIFAPNGQPRQAMQKGLNIVILPDGTVKKIMLK
jgi:hypothetical protein